MPAVLLNETKGTVVAERLEIADNLWSRFKGLMLRRSFPQGEGLLIRPSSSIHTAFMRFPIDVVFVDKSNNVVKVVPELKPFRVAFGAGHSVLELPAGAAAAAQIEKGDRLVLAPGLHHNGT